MLYKKFQLIKNEIDTGNYSLACKLLAEIEFDEKSNASKALHAALLEKLPHSDNNASYAKLEQATYSHLSDFDSQNIKPGISIVSCCMNRNENLLKALKTWVKLPVDEIVIVDWSSKHPVCDTIKEINDARIKILRVEDESKWVLTYGFNVGLRFASYSKVFKFDADIEVSEDFLERNSINSQQFVRGYWKSALDQGLDSQVFVNGSFGAYKQHLKDIGYYNELIRTYGWDDSDLYERLASNCGLSTTYLDFKSILHMEQKAGDRTAHQDVIIDNYLGVVPTTEFNNQRNKFIGRTTEYWNINRLQNYDIIKLDNNNWALKRTTQEINIPNYLIADANSYAAMHFLWHREPQLISKSSLYKELAQFIFREYESGVHFDITKELLGELDNNHMVIEFNSKNSSFRDFLNECINIAKSKRMRLYALVHGDSFLHKRLGDLNGFVEVITLTETLASAISEVRTKNGLEPISIDNMPLSKETVEKTLESLFNPKVYIDAQHGLGNRIRAIGSAAAIANKTGRELVIVWQSDHHCECEFDDLFDYQGKVIKESFLNEASLSMDVYNYMEIEAGSCKDKLIEINDSSHLYLRAAYTFNSPYSHWDTENEFIRSLIPTKEIQDLVEDFNLSNCIAAHIRMEAGAGLDHNTYDSVENWTQEGHDQLHFWREKSHYSHFIKRIDEILNSNSNVKLFLATDLPETYSVFEDYYGERLVYLKRELYDRSKEQIKYALADAILLSRASKLLGSTWSSFSELAMRMSTTYREIEMSGRDF
ncbi:glycosyltransferase [Vibrio variabilis]|uniref:glycosyltransferase n=1 Tax=Vibrio variabilis TaxID=990271 RepID=UPI000DD50F4D|nr:glycosyltransferase [Vibrio variabilis]